MSITRFVPDSPYTRWLTRVFLVYSIMFLVPAGGLFHCIASTAEVTYFLVHGTATPLAGAVQFVRFFVPVLLGNTVGGVVLVGLLGYGMTRNRRFPNREHSHPELSWSEWLFGRHTGRLRDYYRRDSPADGEE